MKVAVSPLGWTDCQLGDLCRDVDKRGPGELADFTYVDIAGIDRITKQIVDARRLPIDEAPSRAKQRLQTGDVLVSMTRPNLNAVATVTVHLNGAIGSTGFHVLRPILVNPAWLYLAVQTDDFVAEMETRVQGALYPAVRPTDITRYRIPLPPLTEQNRIIEVVEQSLSGVNKSIQELDAQSKKLQLYRATVLKAACEGRLVPTEAELARAEGREYESGEELLSRLLAADSKRSVRHAPDGWGSASIEQLNPAKRPCAYGVLQPGNDDPSGVPLVRVGDINAGKVDLTAMKRVNPAIANRYPRTRLQGDEVLITLVGAIGRTAVAPKVLAGANVARAVGVIPLIEGVQPAWVEIWLRNPSMIREMTAKSHEVARKTLNLEDVRATPVAIPPLAEQHRIVAEVDRRLSVVEQLEAAIARSLQRAARLRQAILKQAFEGRLVPQDPNDEPASLLLERIRKEREAAEPPVKRKQAAGRTRTRKSRSNGS